MSLDTVTRSLKRKLNFATPPSPAAPPACRAGGLPRGEDWGSSARPRPPLVPGRTPVCSLPPTPPPRNLVWNRKEMRNVPSIGRRRPVPGGCWAPHGGLGGRIAPADRADTWPLPPPTPAAGVQASRGPPGRGRGIGAGGIWPAATMALGCIVVKAPEVLQRRLVTELILVLWGRGAGLSQGLRPAPAGADSHRLGSGPRTASPLPACKPPLPLQQGPRGWGSDSSFVSTVTGRDGLEDTWNAQHVIPGKPLLALGLTFPIRGAGGSFRISGLCLGPS